MANTSQPHPNSIDELIQLGYQEDTTVGEKEVVRFFVFKQVTNEIPKVIIVIYYVAPLTVKNSGFMFKEGHEIMLKHLDDGDDKKDDITKVAFILALSNGISPTMLTIHTLTSGIVKISDRRLRPTILYSEQEKSPIKVFETIAYLARRSDRHNMDVSISAKSIKNAHEEALKKAL